MFAKTLKSNIMTRSYCRLWNHVIFGTKNRQPLINSKVEPLLYNYISDQLKKCECLPIAINGMPDHVHLLFLSNYKMSLADIMKQVKGASSFWTNKNKISPQYFGWQDSFHGKSVSEENVKAVKRYIQQQKIHHATKTFQQECDEFIAEYGEDIDGLQKAG
jgi:putative transposase